VALASSGGPAGAGVTILNKTSHKVTNAHGEM